MKNAETAASAPAFDDLTASFATSFNVSNFPNDTNKPHPRFAQYKMKSSPSSQDLRRKKLLEHQKARRDDFMNFSRCLADRDLDDEVDMEEEKEEEEEDMDTAEVGLNWFEITETMFWYC